MDSVYTKVVPNFAIYNAFTWQTATMTGTSFIGRQVAKKYCDKWFHSMDSVHIKVVPHFAIYNAFTWLAGSDSANYI